MSENKIKIVASSIEEWQKLSDALKKLPSETVSQLDKVESGFAIICIFKAVYKDKNKLYIPKDMVTQIAHFDGYIGFYCGDFFLKAPKEDFPYEYVFVKSPSE